ncbi:N-acetyltransferase [Chrysiogenes arsenatis]|uniref:N-acetyltransferase n=1 Tax=Chrysiogenes arsenatis TaxID=309797 RepID=UPI0004104C0A|nr:N-acetyltransferase [Chrysiogenes arsenatis]
MIVIEKGLISDARTIHTLINSFAGEGLMLPKSLTDVYENIRDFFVARSANGDVVACGALRIIWEDLAEVCSLAVHREFQGQRMGALIVSACLEEARSLGIARVFALTYQLGFFEKMGFVEIDKNQLPHKIWADCIKCSKFPECDEIAVEISLK